MSKYKLSKNKPLDLNILAPLSKSIKNINLLPINRNKRITTNDSCTMASEKKEKNNKTIDIPPNSIIKSSKCILLLNKQPNLSINNDNSNYNRRGVNKLPKITQFLTEADALVKRRKNLDGLIPIRNFHNITINKLKEVSLKNYNIGLIKEKREEIKKKSIKISEEFQERQNEYEKNYLNYLNVMEENRKKSIEEEEELSIIKNNITDKENRLNDLINENKKLEERLKRTVNSLMIYKRYGDFINKIFDREFKFGQIKNFDGKSYYKIMQDFIDISDSHGEKEDDFLQLLKGEGEKLFFEEYRYMENKFKRELENCILMEQKLEIEKHKNHEAIEMMLKDKQEDEEYNKEMNHDKYKIDYMINDLKEYKIRNEIPYMKYIIELGIALELPDFSLIEDEDISTCADYSIDVLKELERKEIIINKCIYFIDKIFNRGDKDEICLIEYIIYDRKKHNKLSSHNEMRKIFEKSEWKKNNKILESANKIIIKGRKIIRDYPFVKISHKKIKVNTRNHIDLDFNHLTFLSNQK